MRTEPIRGRREVERVDSPEEVSRDPLVKRQSEKEEEKGSFSFMQYEVVSFQRDGERKFIFA